MSEQNLAEAAARVLKAQRDTVAALPTPGEDHEAIIRMMQRTLDQRARRRRLVPIVATTLAAAAAVVAYVELRHHQTSTLVKTNTQPVIHETQTATHPNTVAVEIAEWNGPAGLTDPRGEVAPRTGARMRAGQRLVTYDGARVALRLDTGSKLVVEAGSDMALLDASDTQRFLLLGGRMSFDVAPLLAQQRFIISTPDSEVEVRGTAFRVDVLGSGETCASSRTRVTVEHGLVAVRHGGLTIEVPGGHTWPKTCHEPTNKVIVAAKRPGRSIGIPAHEVATAEPPPSTVVAPPDMARTIDDAKPSRDTVAPALPASNLQAQNDLFERALGWKASGQLSRAAEELERLNRSYPGGPLFESALGERLRILIETHHTDARSVAIEYLRRFPKGFAARDAQTLLDR